jgi:hypothetical protein
MADRLDAHDGRDVGDLGSMDTDEVRSHEGLELAQRTPHDMVPLLPDLQARVLVAGA